MAAMVPEAKLGPKRKEKGGEDMRDCSNFRVCLSMCASPSEVSETLPCATVMSLPMSMFDAGLQAKTEGLQQRPMKNACASGEVRGGEIGNEVVEKECDNVKGNSQSAKVCPSTYSSLSAVLETHHAPPW